VQYQDGQTIRLPNGWKMRFLMNWDADTPWLQGFVSTPNGREGASLNFARHQGTTSCGEDIELPHVVHAFIMREEFDEYA